MELETLLYKFKPQRESADPKPHSRPKSLRSAEGLTTDCWHTNPHEAYELHQEGLDLSQAKLNLQEKVGKFDM